MCYVHYVTLLIFYITYFLDNIPILKLTFAAVEEDKVLAALCAVALALAGEHRVNSVAGGGPGGLGDVSVAAVTAALVMAQGHVTLGITLNSDEAVIVIIIINDALVVVILIILRLCCLQIEVAEPFSGFAIVVVFIVVDVVRSLHCCWL